eukprot:Rmarinus@m.28238
MKTAIANRVRRMTRGTERATMDESTEIKLTTCTPLTMTRLVMLVVPVPVLVLVLVELAGAVVVIASETMAALQVVRIGAVTPRMRVVVVLLVVLLRTAPGLLQLPLPQAASVPARLHVLLTAAIRMFLLTLARIAATMTVMGL